LNSRVRHHVVHGPLPDPTVLLCEFP
jgi:hypothetical protein